MDDFGQTSIEYMFFVAGAIMIALIVVLLSQSNIFSPSQNKLNSSIGVYKQLVNATG